MTREEQINAIQSLTWSAHQAQNKMIAGASVEDVAPDLEEVERRLKDLMAALE